MHVDGGEKRGTNSLPGLIQGHEKGVENVFALPTLAKRFPDELGVGVTERASENHCTGEQKKEKGSRVCHPLEGFTLGATKMYS